MSDDNTIALPVGFKYEEFEIVRVLGAGGFGITYLAYDHNLDKPVAIKEFLPRDMASRVDGVSVKPHSSEEAEDYRWGLESFLKEARALARFKHPNLIHVYRFMKAHGTAYIVMEYAEGETLTQLLKREGALSEVQLKGILLPILDGLEQVHRADYLHRDIKPGNIVICDEDSSPVLIDFGAARQAVGIKSKSVTSIVTPGYAPIEQYSTKGKQGPWTDIYALGAVSYRAITGIEPDDATERIVNDELQATVNAGKGNASEGFLRSIDIALKVKLDERPQTIGEWRKLLEGAPSRDSSVPNTPQIRPKPRSGSKTTAPEAPKVRSGSKTLALLLLLLACAGIWYQFPVQTLMLFESYWEEFPRLWDVSKAASERQAEEAAKRQPQQHGLAGEMVDIPAGTFRMGSNDGEFNESPVHNVRVPEFRLGKYEVTQGQWEQVMGTKPSYSSSCGDNCPVVQVSWDNVQEFIRKLNQQTTGGYRLPTEAEWEYACRSGGRDEEYCGGNSPNDWAWYAENSDIKIHPVGQKRPNGLGVYDMSGNVSEWIQDCWNNNYRDAPDDGSAWLSGDCSKRVIHGGSWNDFPRYLRSTFRFRHFTDFWNSYVGFRLAHDP